MIYENYILQKSPSIQPEQKDNFSKIANKSKIFSQTYLNCGLLPPFLIPAFISDDVGRLLDHLHPLALLLLQEAALGRGHETVGGRLASHLACKQKSGEERRGEERRGVPGSQGAVERTIWWCPSHRRI